MASKRETDWAGCLTGLVVIIILVFAARAADSYSRGGNPSTESPSATQSAYTPPPFTVPPATSGVLCMDGWVSHSVGRGTCSHHGGER